MRTALLALLLGTSWLWTGAAWAEAAAEDDFDSFGVDTTESQDVYEFDDSPLSEPLHYPDWFKKSFLFLPDDLEEAIDAGKRGIAVYFGQRRCPYCQKLLEVNFRATDIMEYTRAHFDIIPIDIWSVEELTDVQGQVLTQREFAVREGTNFTPSLLFYDGDGRLALRLRGYYPPYQFRAALEYVADGHYQRESFKDYLELADPSMTFEPGDLIEEDFFSPPPYQLDRSHFSGQTPLVVFFEQGNCHACDVLHSQPLREPAIRNLLRRFENVQLDIWADTPVVTPDGRRTTAKEWAHELGLFYTPSILFFDEHGREILRVDSVVRFFRLRNVLNYVTTRGYLSEPDFQSWRANSGF